MKDLVDRYIAAVERRLPKAQAKDIVAELREAIVAKIEAAGVVRGRPADTDDIAAILKEFGHPTMVASRFAGHDYLIGPGLYPWFWDAQRMAIGITSAIVIALAAVRALGADEPMRAVIQGVFGVINTAIMTFAIVALVFIAMERSKADARILQKWDPKALPQDQIRRPKPLFDTLFTLAFDAIVILWWVKVVSFPNEVPLRGGGQASVLFAPVWEQVYVPILALALLAAAVHVTDIFHPAWSRLRAVTSIAGHVGGLVVLWLLFRADELVIANGVSATGEQLADIARIANGLLKLSLGVAGLVWGIGLGVEVHRLIQAARPSAMPARGAAA